METHFDSDFKPRTCETCKKVHENRIKFKKRTSKWKFVCSVRCLMEHPWSRDPSLTIRGLTPSEKREFVKKMNAIEV